MAAMLGKRKRKAGTPVREAKEATPDDESGSGLDAQEIFRRHFEAQFEPLPEIKRDTVTIEEDESEEDSEDDWDGISEDSDGANVETIEHTAPISKALMSKNELRRFMSSKPPTDPSSIDSIFASAPKAKVLPSDDDPTETNNLKNDLALQRLIAESHLLDSYTSSSDGPTGSNRHKAMDLRIQSLGAKTSILTQKSMPLSHRRGITKKAEEREETRRKEAKENGIILEIAKSKSKGKELGKRERSVGGPGVGRFKGGTLSLSKNAIKSIEGLKRGAGGRGGRGGGRGRARGKSR